MATRTTSSANDMTSHNSDRDSASPLDSATPPDSRNPPDPGHSPLSRRVINALLGAGCLVSISGFLGAALAYLWPGASRAAVSDMLVGRHGPVSPADIGEDQGVVGRSHLGKILVIRQGERFVGLEATCTHLGCTVAWNAASQQVECPCHGARYDLQGQVLRGPARDPLARVQVTPDGDGLRVAALDA